MALESVKSILKEAGKGGYAVVAFNSYDYGSIVWLIEAAEEIQSPVIVQLYPKMVPDLITGFAFVDLVKGAAARVKTPVGLHLDHCGSFEEIMGYIKEGFTSVMYDGSHLPFDENVKNTAEIVRVAHAMGVDVEAELGAVGQASRLEDFSDKSLYTKPEDAKRFIELTEADSLAVAIGNAHGNYIAEPRLDLDLLERINKVAGVPLVLHGGSGIPDEQLVKAAQKGITKLNVGTEVFQGRVAFAQEGMKDPELGTSSTNLIPLIKEKSKKYYKDKMNLMRGR